MIATAFLAALLLGIAAIRANGAWEDRQAAKRRCKPIRTKVGLFVYENTCSLEGQPHDCQLRPFAGVTVPTHMPRKIR